MTKIAVCALLIALGIAFHFITKLYELEQQGMIVTPWEYWRKHPYASLMVIMAAYLALGVQIGMEEMSYVGSLFIGIGCNSLGDKLRARANASALEATAQKQGP